MSTARYLASRPSAGLFWLLMGISDAARWAAAWIAVLTWAIRGRS